MPAIYSIKRNSLSSKWGVWTTDTSTDPPVEKLVTELKTAEDAEAYAARVQTGEAHDAILASLSGKKPKAESGGLFGKLFKRGKVETNVAPVSNPVIEIETAEHAPAAEQRSEEQETPTQARTSAVEAPSHFEVIEQPKPAPQATPTSVQKVEPAPAPASPPVVESPVAPEPVPVRTQEPVSAEISQAVPEESSTQTVEPSVKAPLEFSESVESQPEIASAPKVSESTESRPAPPVATQADEQSRNDGLLVDWTFTPPPDVTPDELKASGEESPANTTNQGQSGSSTQESQENEDSGQLTMEIRVSKALKEASVGDPRISNKKYNSIASKEYTEVNKAFTTGNSPEYLREELTHLAAVCLAWADAIEKRQKSEGTRAA